MNVLLAAWEFFQAIGVVGMITLGVVVLGVVEAWARIKQKRLDADLKREMLQRGLSVEEIERLAQPIVKVAKLARKIGQSLVDVGVPPEEVTEIMAAFRAADLPTKQILATVIQGIAEQQVEKNGATDTAQLLAAVRGLCSAPRPAPRDVRSSEAIRTL